MGSQEKPQVLLAEDEVHCRVLMKAVLTSMNCEVVGEAKTGAEVLDLFRKLRPHMLFLDINMPLRSGDEVLKEIIDEFPRAFVIMLTSVTDLNSIEKCITFGAANYIRKDTPVPEIKSIIKETWGGFTRTQARLPAATTGAAIRRSA